MDRSKQIEVHGTLFLSVAQACLNLNFFLDDELKSWLNQVRLDGWYPLERFNRMLDIVVARYVDPAPIMERIGIEIATIWYGAGQGHRMIENKGTVEFLRLQTSSQGYYSLVRGDPADIGVFALTELNEQEGTAVIRSTTPFNKDLERGVLIGGLNVINDMIYANVDNSSDPQTFLIEFH